MINFYYANSNERKKEVRPWISLVRLQQNRLSIYVLIINKIRNSRRYKLLCMNNLFGWLAILTNKTHDPKYNEKKLSCSKRKNDTLFMRLIKDIPLAGLEWPKPSPSQTGAETTPNRLGGGQPTPFGLGGFGHPRPANLRVVKSPLNHSHSQSANLYCDNKLSNHTHGFESQLSWKNKTFWDWLSHH